MHLSLSDEIWSSDSMAGFAVGTCVATEASVDDDNYGFDGDLDDDDDDDLDDDDDDLDDDDDDDDDDDFDDDEEED
jgi:hypothetical protein